jgi:hypothetical protein
MTDDNDRSIRGFCGRKQIALSSYYKMRAKGLGPRELRIPDTSIVRITPEAEADWGCYEKIRKKAMLRYLHRI